MRRIGTTIRGIRARHESKAIRGDINRPGAESVKAAAATEREELISTVGGSNEISSVPATFTYVDGGAVSQLCAFAIPVGTFESGYWQAIGEITDGSVFTSLGDSVTTNALSVTLGAHGNGAYNESVAVSAAQLAYINTQAGTSINVAHAIGTTFNPGGTQAVTAFKLFLVPTGGGTVYEVFILGVHPMDGHTDTTQRYIP